MGETADEFCKRWEARFTGNNANKTSAGTRLFLRYRNRWIKLTKKHCEAIPTGAVHWVYVWSIGLEPIVNPPRRAMTVMADTVLRHNDDGQLVKAKPGHGSSWVAYYYITGPLPKIIKDETTLAMLSLAVSQ